MLNWNKIKIHYLLRLVIFWFLFFALFRILFIVYHHAKIMDGQHSETSWSLLHALPLDFATICTLVLIPTILWALQQFYKSRVIHLINKGYNFIIISLVAVVNILNIKMYGEIGRLFKFEDLKYFIHPEKAIFLSTWSMILVLCAAAFFAYIGIRFYQIRFYQRNIISFSLPFENKIAKIAQCMVFALVLFFGYKLGSENFNKEQESVLYSNQKINNDIATNAFWYFGNSVCDKEKPLK
jgi:hypothetical protein